MRNKSAGREPKRQEMRRECAWDYAKSCPNRLAARIKGGAVVLDSDMASVFRSPESVNSLLRSVISALVKRAKA